MTRLTLVGATGQEVVVEYVTGNGMRRPRKGWRAGVITAFCESDVYVEGVKT